MMAEEAPIEAEVLTEIPNRAVVGGAPFLLVRGVGGEKDGCFALARKIGDAAQLESDWVREEKIVDSALRVLAGDQAALTHPKALLHVSIAFAGVFVAAARRGRECAIAVMEEGAGS
jgi:hypothetical protein